MKAKKNHTMVGPTLPKDELTKVLVCRHHNCLVCRRDLKHFVIRDSGLELRDVRDFMAIGSEGVDYRSFDPLVAQELQ
jgi:hypothetical protein